MGPMTTVAPPATLPLDPARLAALDPDQRRELYAALDLDAGQRDCAEQALRIAAIRP